MYIIPQEQKKISPGEDWTPDLCMSDTVYKYDALTNCATGELVAYKATNLV